MINFFFPLKTLCICCVFWVKNQWENFPHNNALGETPRVHTAPLWLSLLVSPQGLTRVMQNAPQQGRSLLQYFAFQAGIVQVMGQPFKLVWERSEINNSKLKNEVIFGIFGQAEFENEEKKKKKENNHQISIFLVRVGSQKY